MQIQTENTVKNIADFGYYRAEYSENIANIMQNIR